MRHTGECISLSRLRRSTSADRDGAWRFGVWHFRADVRSAGSEGPIDDGDCRISVCRTSRRALLAAQARRYPWVRRWCGPGHVGVRADQKGVGWSVIGLGGVDADAMLPVAGGLAKVLAVGEVEEDGRAVCMSSATVVAWSSVCSVRLGAKVSIKACRSWPGSGVVDGPIIDHGRHSGSRQRMVPAGTDRCRRLVGRRLHLFRAGARSVGPRYTPADRRAAEQ
jgi:hypothetical protein